MGAIKAAQLGLKTACVEKRATLGGTCLNVGCIPSKALLQNSHFYHLAKDEFAQRGIALDGGVRLDLPVMMGAKEKSVKELTGGVQMLFKKNKVTHLHGAATILGPNKVRVALGGDAKAPKGEPTVITAREIVIATGSDWIDLPEGKEAAPSKGKPAIAPIRVDERQVVSSTGALALTAVPKRMVVIGGGIIGLELGSVWARLGAEVIVVEFLPAIGSGMDGAVAAAFAKILAKQGIKFRMNTRVIGQSPSAESPGRLTVHTVDQAGGAASTIDADVILVAIGRKAHVEGLGLEALGVKVDAKGRVVTDASFCTNIPSIRAIGDVIAGPMLAHKAEEEGIAVAEKIAASNDGAGHVNYKVIPSVVYTHPEVAWVGQTEEEVKASGASYNIGTFPFMANSRAKTVNDAEGFVKVIADSTTDRILGVHIIGPSAGELIAEAALGMEYGASSEDIARTCHAHPTFSEAVKEACLAAHGLKKAINC